MLDMPFRSFSAQADKTATNRKRLIAEVLPVAVASGSFARAAVVCTTPCGSYPGNDLALADAGRGRIGRLTRTDQPARGRLAQPRAGFEPEEGAAADRIPLRSERRRLADRLQVAPYLGQATLGLERGASAVPEHQVHRLACTVARMHCGEPAAGALLERGLAAVGKRIPQLRDHRVAIDASGIEDRIGAPDGVLHLRIVTQPARAAARRLLAGKLDERVDAGARQPGDHRALVRADPGRCRQGVSDARPMRPLIVERYAGMDHRAPLRQKEIRHRPIEAAGSAQPAHLPAAGNDLDLGTREQAAPEHAAVVAAARLAVVENLEAAEHPGGFMAAAAEGPAPADAIAALDRHRLAAALHRGAGNHGTMVLRIDLLHAVVRKAERDQLAAAVVGDVPADRACAFGQELDDADVGQRIGLQAAERPRQQEAVKARRMHLLDELRRQPLLALDLVLVVPQCRLERGGGLYHRLGIDVDRQAAVFNYGLHRHLLLPTPSRDGRAWLHETCI